jgi:hypothetical protein
MQMVVMVATVEYRTPITELVLIILLEVLVVVVAVLKFLETLVKQIQSQGLLHQMVVLLEPQQMVIMVILVVLELFKLLLTIQVMLLLQVELFRDHNQYVQVLTFLHLVILPIR